MRRLLQLLPLAALALIPCTSTAADLEKGFAAFDVGDYETSLAECQPLADEGNAAAQFCVGRLYANGFGVPMDDAQALRWYGAAADQGYPAAQYNLGVMHANGWGVQMSDGNAAEFYIAAAAQGYVPAVMSLAEVCYRGMGVEEDAVEAYAWYLVAVKLGSMTAVSKRDELVERLTAEEVTAGQQRADERLSVIDIDAMYVGGGAGVVE